MFSNWSYSTVKDQYKSGESDNRSVFSGFLSGLYPNYGIFGWANLQKWLMCESEFEVQRARKTVNNFLPWLQVALKPSGEASWGLITALNLNLKSADSTCRFFEEEETEETTKLNRPHSHLRSLLLQNIVKRFFLHAAESWQHRKLFRSFHREKLFLKSSQILTDSLRWHPKTHLGDV